MRHRSRLSRNVSLTIIAVSLDALAQGVWLEVVLSAYVYVLFDSNNSVVGLIDGVYGITQLCVALPTAWLADKWRKDIVVKGGGIFIMFAAALTFVAVWAPTSRNVTYGLLLGGSALWGIAEGATTHPLHPSFIISPLLSLDLDDLQALQKGHFSPSTPTASLLGSVASGSQCRRSLYHAMYYTMGSVASGSQCRRSQPCMAWYSAWHGIVHGIA